MRDGPTKESVMQKLPIQPLSPLDGEVRDFFVVVPLPGKGLNVG